MCEEHCLLGCIHGSINYRCLLGLCTMYIVHGTKSQKASIIYTNNYEGTQLKRKYIVHEQERQSYASMFTSSSYLLEYDVCSLYTVISVS
jgi:hypothetical protein